MSKHCYDYILVGSGHNSLVCAYYLAKKYKVLIIEKNSDFGGSVATSSNLTLENFSHDLAAMNLNLFAGSPFFQEAGAELIEHGLEFVASDKPCASVFPDDTFCAVYQDLNKTLNQLKTISPKDAESWKKLNAQFFSQVEHILPILSEKMPSFATLKHLYRGVRKNKINWLYDAARLFIASSRDFATENFEHPKTQSMVSSWSMHLDFAPDIAGGALFSYLENFASQNFGMVVGKGGAINLVNSLTSLLKSKGVEFKNNTLVNEIKVNSQTKGTHSVLTNTKEEFIAKKGVIANCNPYNLFNHLINKNHLDTDFLEKISQFKPGVGTMMIHLALDHLPKWKASEELQKFAYIHIAPYMENIAQSYTDCQRGFLPTNPFMVVGQPTAVDSSRAPENKHTLWIQVRSVPAEIKGDALNQIESKDWKDVKEIYADRVIEIIDNYCHQFSSGILARKVFSPKDLEEFNPNLIGGCNLSGSSHLNQNLFMRPIAGYSRYKTPIKNIYMIGASTWPGAGVGGGSGRLLGKSLI